MALVPRRQAALARRITTYSLVADVVLALFVGLVISHFLGVIIFLVGLAVTGVVYYNVREVMRNRGYR